MTNQTNITEAAYQAAEDWYNSTPKTELLAWATTNGLDVGQDLAQLNEDWNSCIIDAYAATR